METSFLLVLMLTSSCLLLIPALTCLHMNGLQSFFHTLVEGQNKVVQPSKRFKKNKTKQSSSAQLAKRSRRTENTDLKICFLLSLVLFQRSDWGFLSKQLFCKMHHIRKVNLILFCFRFRSWVWSMSFLYALYLSLPVAKFKFQRLSGFCVTAVLTRSSCCFVKMHLNAPQEHFVTRACQDSMSEAISSQ